MLRIDQREKGRSRDLLGAVAKNPSKNDEGLDQPDSKDVWQ